MILHLTDPQVEVVSDLVASAVRDLSYEIAATENPHYRLDLKTRRDRLSEVGRELQRSTMDVRRTDDYSIGGNVS